MADDTGCQYIRVSAQEGDVDDDDDDNGDVDVLKMSEENLVRLSQPKPAPSLCPHKEQQFSVSPAFLLLLLSSLCRVVSK